MFQHHTALLHAGDTVHPSIQLAVTYHRYVQLTLGEEIVPK